MSVDEGPQPGGRRAGWGFAASVTLALAAIWSVDYLPTHDGPQHIYTVHASLRLDDAGLGYGRYLEAGHPLTARGFAAVFAPFDLWLPWKSAYRVALGLMVLVWLGGSMALARALDPRRLWLGVLVGAAAFPWSLYMGLFSFYLASGFGLWVLAFVIWRAHPRAIDHAIFGALLLLQALFHIFPALLTGALAGAIVLARTPARARLRTGLATFAAGLPTLWIGLTLAIGAGEQTAILGRDATQWHYEWPGLWLLGKGVTGGPLWRAWPLTVLAFALPAVAAFCLRDRLSSTDRTLMGFGAAWLLCVVALPLHLQGWDFFSLRFALLGLAASILAFPMEALSRPAWRTLSLGCLAVALANQLWALDYNRELDRRSAPALAGLEAGIERNAARLAIVLDPYLGRPFDDREAPMPFVVPLLNLGQLYATEQGGFPADTFAVSTTTHSVLIRDDAPKFPPYPDRSYAIPLAKNSSDRELRRRITAYASSFGAGFEDVIVYGDPEAAAQLRARGYEIDYARDGLVLARFQGCPLTLEFDSTLDRDTEVELGWFPLLEVAERHLVHSDGSPRIDFRHAPCGPVWLRVSRAPTSAPREAGPTLACRGADPNGRLVLRNTRSTPLVRCDLEAS